MNTSTIAEADRSTDDLRAVAAAPGLDNKTHALLCSAALTAARSWMDAHRIDLINVRLFSWGGAEPAQFDHWPEPHELEASWGDGTFECVIAFNVCGVSCFVVGIYDRRGGTMLGDLIACAGQTAALKTARRWVDAHPELTMVTWLYGDAYTGLVQVQASDGSWGPEWVRIFIDEHRPVDVEATLAQLLDEGPVDIGPYGMFSVPKGEPPIWIEDAGIREEFLRGVED